MNQHGFARLRIAGGLLIVEAALLMTYGIVVARGAPALTSPVDWLILGLFAVLSAALAIGVGAIGIAVRRGRRWAYVVAWLLVVLGILGWFGNRSFWNWLALMLSLAIGFFLAAGRREVRKSTGH